MDERPELAPEPAAQAGENDTRPPAFNLPAALVAAIAFLVTVFVVDAYLLSDELYRDFFVMFGFIPARYVYSFAEQGLEWLWTPVTYSFLHGGIEHLVFNCLWLAAFGAPVLRRIGTKRFVVLWVLSAAASAFGHAALHWGEVTLLIGASGVVSALMGAACRFAFGSSRRAAAYGVHLLPRQSIAESFRNRTVVIFTGVWLFGNLLIAAGLPLIGDISAEIAWDAHIGGFAFGFFLFGLFDPARPRTGPI